MFLRRIRINDTLNSIIPSTIPLSRLFSAKNILPKTVNFMQKKDSHFGCPCFMPFAGLETSDYFFPFFPHPRPGHISLIDGILRSIIPGYVPFEKIK
jgi:hypothetical protein